MSRILLFGFGGALTAIVGATASGCGGRTLVEVVDDAGGQDHPPASSGSGGSGSTGGSGGSGGSGWGSSGTSTAFYVCPPTEPWPNTACDTAGLVCAYYTNTSCFSFVCDDSLSWQESTLGC